MPPTTRSSSKVVESVASRVKRDTRTAAVEANQRMQEMAAQDMMVRDMITEYQPVYQMVGRVCNCESKAPVAQHRYMLRSMRR